MPAHGATLEVSHLSPLNPLLVEAPPDPLRTTEPDSSVRGGEPIYGDLPNGSRASERRLAHGPGEPALAARFAGVGGSSAG